MESIFRFSMQSLGEGIIDSEAFRGKKMVVVNVASECGYTPQYSQLQELYQHFQDTLTIIGVPSNDFGGQEPGSDEDIRTFCATRYRVTFPMATKVPVTGSDAHELFQWFATHANEHGEPCIPEWNFHKFLIDSSGALVGCVPSAVSPLDPPIMNWVQHV